MQWSLFIVNIMMAIVGFRYGRQKGHPILGLLLGLFLSVLGLIILLIVVKIMESRARRAGERMSAESQGQGSLTTAAVNVPPPGRHRAG
jgi:uncharacterized membrane protein